MKPLNVKAVSRRERLLDKSNGHCWYCGCLVDVFTVTRDHVLPKCRGGTDGWRNIVPACKMCNSRKGNRTTEEFRKFLATTRRKWRVPGPVVFWFEVWEVAAT